VQNSSLLLSTVGSLPVFWRRKRKCEDASFHSVPMQATESGI
jgi:hypothetical protein